MTKKSCLFYAAVLLLFVAYGVFLAAATPFAKAPDEPMRYAVCEYIHNHGTLPVGSDPEIRNPDWGFSYAFYPITPYIAGGFAMRLLDGVVPAGKLYMIPRAVSLLCSVVGLLFIIAVARKLFREPYAGTMVASIAFLPMFGFVSSYVNVDAYGLMTVAMIIYFMLRARETRWRLSDCAGLGVSVGLCLISYYNCYPVVGAAALFSFVAVLQDPDVPRKGRFLSGRIAWVILFAFLVAGWWFIRNGVLYDGDILGMDACSACGEKYAAEEFRPSLRSTLYTQGVSFRSLMTSVPWMVTACKSYVGLFGIMDVPLPNGLYVLVFAVIGAGFAGNLLELRRENRPDWNRSRILLASTLLLVCALELCLNWLYTYFVDYQPQGRYMLPMYIALAAILTNGWKNLIEAGKSGSLRRALGTAAVSGVFLFATVYSAVLIRQVYKGFVQP